MTEEQAHIIWLSSIHQIGPKKYKDLMRYYGSAKAVYEQAEADEIKSWPGWGAKTALLLEKARNARRLEDVCTTLEKQDVSVYFKGEEGYPALLNEIYDPPPVLYVRGAMAPDLPKCLAMVGTRHCTRYGREAAQTLASALCESGCTIVSGMARGIDTSAHLGALKAGGFTVAVLGCGPDVIYPPENTKVYEEILQSGCVISEYYPGTVPSAGNFPARNRIISGMCQGVVVVESREKGGSMITVRMAQEQGRDVFAVPGNINSPASKGTNKLLCEGAPPATSAEDILFGIGWQKKRTENKVQTEEKPVLSPEETVIYDLLEQGALPYDALCQMTKMAQGALSSCLTLMEIRGIIRQLPGRIYELIYKE